MRTARGAARRWPISSRPFTRNSTVATAARSSSGVARRRLMDYRRRRRRRRLVVGGGIGIGGGVGGGRRRRTIWGSSTSYRASLRSRACRWRVSRRSAAYAGRRAAGGRREARGRPLGRGRRRRAVGVVGRRVACAVAVAAAEGGRSGFTSGLTRGSAASAPPPSSAAAAAAAPSTPARRRRRRRRPARRRRARGASLGQCKPVVEGDGQPVLERELREEGDLVTSGTSPHTWLETISHWRWRQTRASSGRSNG